MKRLLINLLAVISLLLCLAVAGLWPRGYWALDGAQVTVNRRQYVFASTAGRIAFVTGRWEPPQSPPSTQPFFHSPPEALDDASLAPMAKRGSPDEFRYGTFGGFGWIRMNQAAQRSMRAFFAPNWAVALGLLLLPAWRIRIELKRRRAMARLRAGLCGNCGYDLRATPQRCPECGAVADAAAPHSER